MRLIFSCLFILTVFFAPLNTQAQTSHEAAQTDTNNNASLVNFEIIPEKSHVSGGDTIWIGIKQIIKPHWHTYWINPGDSGTPTSASWDLPDGAQISDIYWPAPQKLPYGPLLNYGYEGEPILLQKLTLPETIPDGALTLSVDIETLVCKEECIPEYGTYTLTLNTPDAPMQDNADLFAQALQHLPIHHETKAQYTHDDTHLILTIDLNDALTSTLNPDTIATFPLEWGLVHNAKASQATLDQNTLTIRQPKGERPLDDVKSSNFVITYNNINTNTAEAIEITASAHTPTLQTTNTVSTSDTTTDIDTSNTTTIAKAIMLAILGGIILNLMPCVFPVLSIKALSLVKIADKSHSLARLHGVAYTVGVILSFVAIAGLLLILKSSGAYIGWGFQLQSPIVVGALAYLLFIIGLNLIGFFEFGNAFANTGNKLTQGNGLNSSFFTGVLATLVATPCTAPFMAAAIGFALTQTALINLLIFASIGLGLALPYLALSFIPALQKSLPKPGAWMNTFKELLAFPIFFSSIWLIWVLSKQTGSTGLLQALLAFGFTAFAIWLWQHAPKPAAPRFIVKLFALAGFAATLFMLITLTTAPAPSNSASTTSTEIATQKFGETFNQEKLTALLEESDEPIFVEMTAAWCITCKANHAIAVNTSSTKQAFSDNNVHYLIGDWTNQDAHITKYLNAYGRNGVPLYVFYGAKDSVTKQRPEPKVLPQILTPGTIRNLF